MFKIVFISLEYNDLSFISINGILQSSPVRRVATRTSARYLVCHLTHVSHLSHRISTLILFFEPTFSTPFVRTRKSNRELLAKSFLRTFAFRKNYIGIFYQIQILLIARFVDNFFRFRTEREIYWFNNNVCACFFSVHVYTILDRQFTFTS